MPGRGCRIKREDDETGVPAACAAGTAPAGINAVTRRGSRIRRMVRGCSLISRFYTTDERLSAKGTLSPLRLVSLVRAARALYQGLQEDRRHPSEEDSPEVDDTPKGEKDLFTWPDPQKGQFCSLSSASGLRR
jgi:hypothetical protein